MSTVQGNSNCKLCSLHEDVKSVCVMGDGRAPAKVMIVGEAPGAREDKVGKPFQGEAGQLLNRTLEKAGIDRTKCYVTNVVKCRPPENRAPKTGEMKACKIYLDKEINKIQPKFVILLGATALKGVLKQTGITEKHGQVIEQDGITYLPTFHPAAALHDPRRRGPIEQDFKKFGLLISGKKMEKPELRITEIVDRKSFLACLAAIKDTKWVSFDTETSGLDPRVPDACIKSLQVGTRHGEFVLPLEIEWSPWKGDKKVQRKMLKAIRDELRKCKEVSAANGKFDCIWLQIHYNLLFPMTFDVGAAAFILDENEPTSLKYRARVDLGAHDWDVEEKQKTGKNITKEEFYEYGCYDVYYTRKLAMLYEKRLRETDGLWELFRWLVMPAARLLVKVEQQGFYINRKRQAEVRKDLNSKMKKVMAKLDRHSGGKVNWNSPAQVGELLFNKVGLTPLDKTDGGANSTSESVLKRLADQHPIPKLLVEYRGYAKLLSTYVDGWEELTHGDRVYFGFKLTGTVTGRLSSRLHQVPRDPMIRSLLDAPEGWVFWTADFSQVELRLTAMLSGDIAMMTIYKENGDIHTATACDVLGLSPDKITKDQRKRAKAVNFGFVYGMMAKKFVIYARDDYDVHISLDEANRFRNNFFKKFTGLLPWHKRMKRLVKAQGFVRNPIGRIRRLPDIASNEWGKRSEAERQAINSPVQGFGSDLKLMSMIELGEKIDWNEIQILGEHHDAIMGLVRKEVAVKWMKVVKETMESPALLKKFNVRIPVPIVAEVEIGPWGKGEKVMGFDLKRNRFIFEEK